MTIGSAAWLSISQTSILLSISFVPIIIALITGLGCWVKVKRNCYISKKNSPNLVNIVGFSAIGAFVGKIFSDFFSSVHTDMTSEILFFATGLIAIATLFAIMGTPSFLKIHYLKALKRMNINLD
ncbi:MAG: hypothetical protein IKC26_04385 [Clostridia bacterium]|nr:hypothetical protein [Clostridia bacterium]